jgi:hypothetical protein
MLSSGTCPAADVDLPKDDNVCFNVSRHDSGAACSSPDVGDFVDHCPIDLVAGIGVEYNFVDDELTFGAGVL